MKKVFLFLCVIFMMSSCSQGDDEKVVVYVDQGDNILGVFTRTNRFASQEPFYYEPEAGTVESNNIVIETQSVYSDKTLYFPIIRQTGELRRGGFIVTTKFDTPNTTPPGLNKLEQVHESLDCSGDALPFPDRVIDYYQEDCMEFLGEYGQKWPRTEANSYFVWQPCEFYCDDFIEDKTKIYQLNDRLLSASDFEEVGKENLSLPKVEVDQVSADCYNISIHFCEVEQTELALEDYVPARLLNIFNFQTMSFNGPIVEKEITQKELDEYYENNK